ncbi:MAG TPA: hypothetical protein VLY82_06955 [Nitrososphaerales archaeon]|nr:hypothetical protein [Nitrososphaerales archaeon]
MSVIQITVQGRSPYLMHHFGPKAEADVQTPGIRAHRGERGTPREQAEEVVYRSKNGALYIPGGAMYRAIVDAGKFHKHGRNKLTTGSSSLVPSGLWLDEEDSIAIPLMLGEKPIVNYEVDGRAVFNAKVGARIMCFRPRIDKWEATFRLTVDDSFFTQGQVRDLVDDAGKKIGIGAFRVERKGPFGRFEVKKWKVEIAAQAA